ncbi:XRE family transcriptional regulator [Lacticaseibacillus saniviri]|uniref:XRE family transcriptional regulator n=1 Tax=Lacticaseibacillus saniviri TaxID=931533 RepID=UPI0007048B73|nr:XRE family transcriptional regulator [Lacticaseibacillus saniviri]
MFAQNLKYLRIKHGFDQQQFASKIHRSVSTISEWESGKYTPKAGILADIAHIFNVRLDDMMNIDLSKVSDAAPSTKLVELTTSEESHIHTIRQLTPDRQTKVYKFATSQLDEQNEPDEEDADDDNVIDIITGRATAAGSPINGDDQDGLATMERVSVTDIPHGTDEIVTVDGDSMEPYYPKYSQIFVHWQDTIEDGELAVVHVCDEGVTFKQIYLDDDEKKIILHSLNDKYDDREFEADEIHIIGKVLN